MGDRPGGPRWLPFGLVVGVAVAAFANSFGGDKHLDDLRLIKAVSAADRFAAIRWAPGERPVAVLTLAANHAVGGDDVWGYHAVNVGVHAAAAAVLYALVRFSMGRPAGGRRPPAAASDAALAAAAIWAAHPLTTQAVTYIVQRMEALMALFVLAAVYAVGRSGAAVGRSGAAGWGAAAVACGLLAAGSKQVAVALPAVALLYDRAFVAGTSGGAVSRRWAVHLGLAAAAGLVFWDTFHNFLDRPADAPAATVGFGMPAITAGGYARTQPAVILHYLRLTAWPHPLCFDHGWPVAREPADWVPQAVAVAAVVAVTGWLAVRRPAVGFLPAAFFLVLAPTSSVVPVLDLAVEHRMYLPLAAVTTGAAVAGAAAAGRRERLFAAAVGLAVAALGAATVARNEDYRSAIGLLQDTVAKAPGNSRAWSLLGVHLTHAERYDEAVDALGAACELVPGEPRYRSDLAAAYTLRAKRWVAAGDRDRALADFAAAWGAAPVKVETGFNLGLTLLRLGRPAEAVGPLRAAHAAAPGNPAVARALAAAEAAAGGR